MSRNRYDRLLQYLHEAVGDGLSMVISYDQESYEFLHGEAAFQRYQSERAEKSPEAMHHDAFLELRKSVMNSETYGNEEYAKLVVTDNGTGIYLVEGETEGIFVWLHEDAEIAVPAFVEGCAEHVSLLPNRD